MIRLAANLTYLFTEVPFLDRFAAAARAGFKAVEFAYAWDVPTGVLNTQLRDNDLSLTLINAPVGNAAAGELGLAALPGRERDAEAAFDQALEYAVELNAPCIHFLTGRTEHLPDQYAVATTFHDNLCRAADKAAKVGRTLTLEPLNKRDRPGYYLRTNAQARAIIEAAQRPNVRLQLDMYHCQIAEGDLIRSMERNIDIIAHVQIASVPERAEPTLGEVAYDRVLARLDALGYKGYVGCEYNPAAGTLAGLGWATRYFEAERESL
jgi:hydroxypyruvate isomerase